MSIHRRELLRSLGGLAAYAAWPWSVGCSREQAAAESSERLILAEPAFLHGVASGDPLRDRVIIWTRLTPRRSDDAPYAVYWEVAADPDFEYIVTDGEVEAGAERDFTVKVDVAHLAAATTYYYRFSAESAVSTVGRTRTAPLGEVERLRFAVASCSSYAHGYFHAYRAIAERLDLDAVIHLGDYLYEYGTDEYGDVRAYEPSHEIVSLADYRRRYGQYRRDPDLKAMHQQHPLIAVWDDHEIANNTWVGGAENHNPRREGDFAARKRSAIQAYFEWMPIRDTIDRRSFRRLAYGDLLDVFMLDTRQWGRTMQVEARREPGFASETRELLGGDQEAWLAENIAASTARWRLLGQQIMVGPLSLYFNPDDWTGYPAARDRLIDLLAAHADKDTIILTGDVHASWVMNIARDPDDPAQLDPETGEGSLAVEFVVPGISSPGTSQSAAEAAHPRLLRKPHVKYVDLWQRGYVVLDIDADRVQAAYYHYASVADPDEASETFSAAFATYAGERRVRGEEEPAPTPAAFPPAAPSDPIV